MIKSNVGHIQININPEHISFYKELLCFLGWSVWHEDPGMLGVGNELGTSLWFAGSTQAVENNYDGVGMNHLGIAVNTQAEVDQVVAYLQEHGIKELFDTPRLRPEFCAGPDKVYYQVMFESPDRVLFEVVYTGPASN